MFTPKSAQGPRLNEEKAKIQNFVNYLESNNTKLKKQQQQQKNSVAFK